MTNERVREREGNKEMTEQVGSIEELKGAYILAKRGDS